MPPRVRPAPKTQVNPKKEGDQEVLRYYEEEYVDRFTGYRGSFPYKRALRKSFAQEKGVGLESLFGGAKDLHGSRRFRLRRLERVNVAALLIASGKKSSACSERTGADQGPWR